MSPIDVLTALNARQLLPPEQATALADLEQKRPLSLHHELRAALSVGVLLLTGGLGLLLYEHYDRLGPITITAGIAGLCAVAFGYAWQHRPPVSPGPVPTHTFADYALLTACLLFLSLEGYAQYQYNLFGTRYGLATFLPAVLFLALAYRFDHRGVLSMGLTALASWVGVTVQPLALRLKTNFFDQPTVLAAVALSVGLIATGLWLQQRGIKAHFTQIILTLAGNLLLVALLAGVFNFEVRRWLYAVPLLAACVGFDALARRHGVFLYRLMGVGFGYVAITYLLFSQLLKSPDFSTELYMIYLIISGITAVTYLIRTYPTRPAV